MSSEASRELWCHSKVTTSPAATSRVFATWTLLTLQVMSVELSSQLVGCQNILDVCARMTLEKHSRIRTRSLLEIPEDNKKAQMKGL